MKAKLIFIGIIIGFSIDSYSQCSISFQVTNVLCCGQCNGSITAIPSGTPPFSYLWSNSQTTQAVTGLCEGTYLCVVTELTSGNQCSASATVSCPISMTITPTNASCSTCYDGSATANVIGGFPPYTYSWAGTGCGTGANSSCTTICPGTYTLCISDSTGCGLCSAYTINYSLGVHEFQNGVYASIFPNPSSGKFTMNSKIANGKIIIYNLFGENIYESQINNPNTEIDLSDKSNGIYFITIKSETESFTQKIIINR